MGNDMEEMAGPFGFIRIHEAGIFSESLKTFPPQRSLELTFRRRPIRKG